MVTIARRVLGFGLGWGLGWLIERSFTWFVSLLFPKNAKLKTTLTKSVVFLLARWGILVIVIGTIFWLWRDSILFLALGLLVYQTTRLMRMILSPQSYGKIENGD